jgi:hypothetical protein
MLQLRGEVEREDRVVLILTGAGIKNDPPALPSSTDLEGDDDAIVAHVVRTLTR